MNLMGLNDTLFTKLHHNRIKGSFILIDFKRFQKKIPKQQKIATEHKLKFS